MNKYDVTSQMYDERYTEEQEAKYQTALEELGGKVNFDNAVLDAGCGSGLFFRHIAPQANMVVGVDLSINLLKKAKEQARGFNNIFLLQADADHLPFREGFFDVSFAFTVLQNMPKPSATLAELKRVGKNDGCIVVTGLKKAFSLEGFMDVLEKSDLKVASFVDDDALKCYVAVLARN
jgi:ubiquinone/menaquinone biosynthesis C-methylase UbiE